jgi:hypothetical protein
MKIATSLFIALSASTLSMTAIAADKKAAPAPTKAAQPAAQQEQGRNWAAIDTNKDGLISPEEMETWLKANPGPARGK